LGQGAGDAMIGRARRCPPLAASRLPEAQHPCRQPSDLSGTQPRHGPIVPAARRSNNGDPLKAKETGAEAPVFTIGKSRYANQKL